MINHAYTAGLFDATGIVKINHNLKLIITLHSESKQLLEQIIRAYKIETEVIKNQRRYIIYIPYDNMKDFLLNIHPYLFIKKEIIKMVIEFLETDSHVKKHNLWINIKQLYRLI